MLRTEDLLEIANIGASSIDPTYNTLTIQAKTEQLSDDDNDAEDFSGVPVFGQLGVFSRPYPADDSGKAQALIMRDGGYGNCIGIRDNRINSVYGALDFGDTCVTAVGPQHASRILLKEDSRVTAVLSKDTDGHDFGMVLDGSNDKAQFFGFKQILEFSKANGINFGTSGDAGSSAIQLTPTAAVFKAPAVKLGEGAVQPVASGTQVAAAISVITAFFDAISPAPVVGGAATAAASALKLISPNIPVQSVIVPNQ